MIVSDWWDTYHIYVQAQGHPFLQLIANVFCKRAIKNGIENTDGNSVLVMYCHCYTSTVDQSQQSKHWQVFAAKQKWRILSAHAQVTIFAVWFAKSSCFPVLLAANLIISAWPHDCHLFTQEKGRSLLGMSTNVFSKRATKLDCRCKRQCVWSCMTMANNGIANTDGNSFLVMYCHCYTSIVEQSHQSNSQAGPCCKEASKSTLGSCAKVTICAVWFAKRDYFQFVAWAMLKTVLLSYW